MKQAEIVKEPEAMEMWFLRRTVDIVDIEESTQ